MTAIIPTNHGTAPVAVAALPATPEARARVRRNTEGEPPAVALLAFSVAAVAVAWFSVLLAFRGWPLEALGLAVLALAILAGAFLPGILAERFDRLRAAEEEQEAGA